MSDWISRSLLGFPLGAMLMATAAVAEPLSLQQAVQLAATQSRAVAATEAQAGAAREMALAAAQLPDPVLKLGLNNLPVDGTDRFSLTRDFMTMRTVGVSQEFTRADKRQARAQRAEREVDAALAARQATLAELRRDTALAWLERSFQESARELLREQAGQAAQQVQAAELQYRNGRGTQAEVYAARGALEQSNDRIDQAERLVAVATIQLERWIGSAARQRLAARPTLMLPSWTEDELAPHLRAHPLLAAAEQQRAIADADAALARAAKQSDWSVEVGYSQRGPAFSNMVSIALSVPLQWDQKNRQDRELAARLANVEQARARSDDLQRAHEAEVRAMLQESRSHAQRLQRYDGALLPLGAQRSAAALGAYQAGPGTLTALLDARRGESELRLERLRVEQEQARLWAQLNYLLPQVDSAGRATP